MEVPKLDLNRDSTLFITIGVNDLFLNDGYCGFSEGLVNDFDRRMKSTKSKTNRLEVDGPIPCQKW